MGLRNSGPISFSPSTVTDALDGTNAPPGSMSALVNLVPDPSTANLFICRPAAEEMTDFTGFNTPGFISVFYVLGHQFYGMVATDATPGYDQPFCYDHDTGAFVTVTGTQDATTLPLSPATTGAWEPPVMSLVGVLLVVTHPGFPGGAGPFIGWFDVTDTTAPTWNAGNTAPTALAAVPKSVAQFNGRAWYAVENDVVFSDALLATTVTNSSQVLTLGDNLDVTALAQLPLNSQVTGGIVQALIAFKGATVMYQIQGDATTSDLTINAFDVATGTLAPNTLAQTPQGLAFVSPDGLRILSTQMIISPPVGIAGSGVSVPFLYAAEPSRMCAAYNSDIYRVSVENGVALGTPTQEWWLHLARGVWTGPHTFPASFIKAFTHDAHPSFVMAPDGVTGKLFDSHFIPDATTVYEENGVQMSFEWTTSILPDTEQMSESYLTETTIKMSLPADISPVTVSAIDEEGTVLQAVQIASEGVETVWGAFTWGDSVWRGTSDRYKPRRVPWEQQPVFRMLQISVTGDSIGDYRIGTMQTRYQFTQYLQQ